MLDRQLGTIDWHLRHAHWRDPMTTKNVSAATITSLERHSRTGFFIATTFPAKQVAIMTVLSSGMAA
jgi:hypothetical protein